MISHAHVVQTARFGADVPLITLSNAGGLSAGVTAWGARLTRLQVPDRDGRLADVVLGYGSLAPYLIDGAFMGATVGRYANRIANARFTLDGTDFRLYANEGRNALHGGPLGFDRRLWRTEVDDDAPGVRFTLLSVDGDGGFPGNLTASVTYTLDADSLRIRFEAASDRATIVNLVNHAYFNLAGHGTIDQHRLVLAADQITPVDRFNIPTGGRSSVAATALDFRTIRPIGRGACDHNFVLRPRNGVELAAEVEDAASGRRMQVLTDRPGLQLYTGDQLFGRQIGHNGHVHEPRSGFCLEAQAFPDAPNHANFPSTVLRPGENHISTTIYRFPDLSS